MARYTGPSCRLCRRQNMELFLKGERCYTDKCAIKRRNYPPGQHGQARSNTNASLKKYKIFIRNPPTRLTLPVVHGIIKYVGLALSVFEC